MRRQPLVTVAVAALLVVAGCSALPGSGGSGAADGEYPEASALNSSQIDTHAAALDGTSFTLSVQSNLSGSQGSLESGSETRVDASDDQYLQRSTSAFGNSTLYTADDTSYRRSESGGQTSVTQVEESVNATAARRGSQVYRQFVSENISYERAGTETFDGADVMRYEAEGVDAISEDLRESTGENTTITSFSATLLLDGDGVIRQFRLSYVAEQNDQTVDLMLVANVTGVGETDVEEPAWVANATTQS